MVVVTVPPNLRSVKLVHTHARHKCRLKISQGLASPIYVSSFRGCSLTRFHKNIEPCFLSSAFQRGVFRTIRKTAAATCFSDSVYLMKTLLILPDRRHSLLCDTPSS